jgi:hypothetical protein
MGRVWCNRAKVFDISLRSQNESGATVYRIASI